MGDCSEYDDPGVESALARLRASGEDRVTNLFKQAGQLLLEGGEAERWKAVTMLEDLLQLQEGDPGSRTYGQWPMSLSRPPGDLNAATFLAPIITGILRRGRASLRKSTFARLETAYTRLLIAVERRWDEEIFDLHRDYKAYTNIFLMYVQAFLLGGLYLADQRRLRVAAGQWRRWFSHISYSGLDEFVSLGYNSVNFKSLLGIYYNALDEQMRKEAALALDYLCATQYAVFHPVLGLQVCGSSRDYRRFFQAAGPAALEPGCLNYREAEDCRWFSAARVPEYIPPARVLQEYGNRQFPFTLSGRATRIPFLFKSWQSCNSALGSMTGGHYFYQQIHCMAAAGVGPEQREVAILPGSYTLANGYVDQAANRALCLFSRQPNSYLSTQKLSGTTALDSITGNLGIACSKGWKVKTVKPGRLVLNAYGHTLTVDSFVVEAGTVRAVSLVCEQRGTLSRGSMFRDTPVDMLEFSFVDEAKWLGCVVQLRPGTTAAEPVEISCRQVGRTFSVGDQAGLGIRLYKQPCGELTELYDQDWRTLPLLDSPAMVVASGDLSAAALGRNFSELAVDHCRQDGNQAALPNQS